MKKYKIINIENEFYIKKRILLFFWIDIGFYDIDVFALPFKTYNQCINYIIDLELEKLFCYCKRKNTVIDFANAYRETSDPKIVFGCRKGLNSFSIIKNLIRYQYRNYDEISIKTICDK